MITLHMADAAFASNIPPGFSAVAGYYGGPNAYHVWSRGDWSLFPGYKLPIWVGGNNGPGEGAAAVAALKALKVPSGSFTVLDLETRQDQEYVDKFTAALAAGGYRVWVYGSASTVYGNPPANGYWVASYGLSSSGMMQILGEPHVRGIQYASNSGYDSSLVKQWTDGGMWK